METRKVVAPKLEFAFERPFLLNQRSELDCVLQLDKDGAEKSVHHNNIKLYEVNQINVKKIKSRKRIAFQNKET